MLIKTYVWIIAMYGCELGRLEGQREKLEAFGMWFYKRILKINWIDRIKNW